MGAAPAGTYGYEPIGVIHDRTEFPEYTELLFTNFGPVAFLNDDDSVAYMFYPTGGGGRKIGLQRHATKLLRCAIGRNRRPEERAVTL